MKIYVVICTNGITAGRSFRWLSGYLRERNTLCRVFTTQQEIDFIGLATRVKFTTPNAVEEYVKGRSGEIIYVDEHEVEKFIDAEFAEKPNIHKETDHVIFKDGHRERINRYIKFSENRIKFKTSYGTYMYEGGLEEPCYLKKVSQDEWIKVDTIDHVVFVPEENV